MAAELGFNPFMAHLESTTNLPLSVTSMVYDEDSEDSEDTENGDSDNLSVNKTGDFVPGIIISL